LKGNAFFNWDFVCKAHIFELTDIFELMLKVSHTRRASVKKKQKGPESPLCLFRGALRARRGAEHLQRKPEHSRQARRGAI